MSISSAFSNSLSGLNASSKRAEMISNNVSNALTEGFGRREVDQSSQVLNGFGAGVRIGDVTRIEHSVATGARRASESEFANNSVLLAASTRLSQSIGEVGDPQSLASRFSELEGALLSASNDPSNQVFLDSAIYRADRLVQNLNDASASVLRVQVDADHKIGIQIKSLNETLVALDDLNLEIQRRQVSGGSVNALKDQQNILIDNVNSIVPTKVVQRQDGQIALFTANGGVLLDDNPTQFDFSVNGTITHGMSIANGALSDLRISGTSIAVNSHPNFFDGGSLSGLFEVRDSLAPAFNAQIDALAGDLISRFQTPTVDATLTTTDPGLFTDANAQYSALNELGAAERISINTQIDPTNGGQTWRLRDGLNALTQGDKGNGATLKNILDAFRASNAPPASIGLSANNSSFGFTQEISSMMATDLANIEDSTSFIQSNLAEFRETELGLTGVNTDNELQNLMEVEKAYAANARVLSVLDELMSRLLEI